MSINNMAAQIRCAITGCHRKQDACVRCHTVKLLLSGAPCALTPASGTTMTDFKQPTSPLPEKAEAASVSSSQDSQVPAAVPAGGAVLAGVAALASLALIFLLPRVGGRFTAWRRSNAGLRLMAPTRDR